MKYLYYIFSMIIVIIIVAAILVALNNIVVGTRVVGFGDVLVHACGYTYLGGICRKVCDKVGRK